MKKQSMVLMVVFLYVFAAMTASAFTVKNPDPGCPVSITAPDVAVPPGLALSMTVTPESCSGSSDGSIDLSVTGGTLPYFYLWSNGATTQDISGLSAGVYTVTVMDAIGLNQAGSQNLASNPLPALFTVTGGGSYCDGGSGLPIGLSGSEMGIMYMLYRNGNQTGGPIVGSGGPMSFGPQIQTGIYSVVAQNMFTGCSTGMANTVSINMNPVLPVAVSIVASENPVVSGTSVTFTATPVNGGLTPNYAWYVNGVNVQSSGSQTYTFTPQNDDVISCVVTSSAACVTGNPASSNAVTMVVQPAMTLTFNTVPDCSYGYLIATVYGGTSPYHFAWSTGATTQDLVNMPAGVYTVMVTDALGWTISGPGSVTVLDCDFGDAPDPSYKTYHMNDGPRHAISGLKLGMFIDTETDGQPNATADGDDTNGSGTDDEDGITDALSAPFTQLHAGTNMLLFTTYNNLGLPAYLQGWIDFDGDKLVDPGEQILTNYLIPQGPFSGHVIFNVLPFANSFFTLARFRLSTTNNLSFTGLAPDGEVEDYYIFIDNTPESTLDYGDAPSTPGFPFPTLKTMDGACHFVDCHVRLGDAVDAEPNGVPSNLADGDGSDEDGVVIPSSFSSLNNIITVYPHNYQLFGTVYLNAWMDFDQNGVWDNASNEHFIVDYMIPYAGTTCCFDTNSPGWPLNIPVPLPLGASGCMYARFRISDAPGLGPTQPSGASITIGEVEDYQVCLSSCPPACENFDDGTSNFMMTNDGLLSNNTLVTVSPGSGGYQGDQGLKVTDISGSTWIYNNTSDYRGNYLLCPNNCLCWDIDMLDNDQAYYPSIFLFSEFNTSLPVGPTNPKYMARFTSSSLVGLNQWAHTCARIQPSLVNGDPPVSPEGTWTWNNYPGKSTLNPAPAWNNFISNIEGIMFRVDVTAWGGSESFILDSICLSPCLTDTVTLTVNSVPCSGVSISATPLDIHGNGVGTSSFTMDYIDGAIVYLTAPPTVICDGEQYCFRNWIINGMNFLTDSNNPVKVKMNADKNYTAVYCKKNKTVDVKARLNNLNGMLLPGVLIGYSPSPYYANPNGLIPVPFSSGPTAPTPFFGTYYYPDCSSNVEYFQLTAPLFYNNHRFITWYVGFTDCYGYSYSLIPTGSNVISYPLDKDYICTAIYDDCCLATVTNAGASCCDGSIDFSFACGTAPYSYAWSNTEVTQDISGLCPGTYCVTVTDSNNNTYVCCWDVAQNKSACQSTFIQNQVIESGRDTCFGALQTIYVAGNGTTFDIQNGGRATMVAGQNIRFLPGTKVLSGGYLHGYIAPSGPFCNVTLPNNPSFNTFGDEVLQGNTLGFYHVYPNPTTGSFFLELNDLDEQAVLRTEIYGMHGEHLFSALLKDQGRYELSLAGKPSGVYFLRVITGKHAGISKIIKQ